ncbi:tRNA (N6-isopentenyl adenosine(37)-C2)-methylthiotransferase MiaB, partial [Francisella tularensis subsp. holarctica]|nr:tRNA (N6-isopentenyl adenosine(37)-C2)-methylthiotransferase MiaB [Francisella tularensis subsp. holarctica]
MKEQKKVFIKTLGCQMKEYDSARMHEVLNDHFDTENTDDNKYADNILINTFSI